jgi:A/G-specific adenine glycosylase
LGDVLRLWQGLGYPRRARNLQGAAIEVERLGAFPSSLEGLLALPGVGAYTARAVLAFAYETDAAVVDTNIARVHARVVGRQLTAREAQTLADDALPMGQAWEWNQCLMDLGAVLCRPRTPLCQECPLRSQCAWRGEGADPAVGSAGVSRAQAPFEGSDRQARGRLMKSVGDGPVPLDQVAIVMRRGADHADRLMNNLLSEGLLVRDGTSVRLP